MAAGSTRMVTVLFTDAVGSTALLTRVGPQRADALRRQLDLVCRDTIGRHDGREVKHTGDGLMVAFDSCAAAVEASAALQVATHAARDRTPELSELRIGIAVGEAVEEDGDLFGTPAVEAARLCNAADAGQILATSLVAAMAGSLVTTPMHARGEQLLKGFDRPTPLVEIGWEPAPAIDTLPQVVRNERRVDPLTGRGTELEQLRAAWRASGDGGQFVLVVGEPGIGKTRLLAEFAAEVDTDGSRVMWGRCDEALNIVNQPFIEGLRHLVSSSGPRTWIPWLARLVPDLAATVAPDGLPMGAADEAERLLVFDAVRDTLTDIARDGPVLVVLDDLHWASHGTIHLLRHVLRGIADASVVVAATYRDTDLGRRHPLTDALGDLRRIVPTTRLALGGLGLRDVTQMAAPALAGAPEDSDLASLILAETAGNPFFVSQIVRHLADSGGTSIRDMDVPEGVREVVGRRLTRLPDPADELLSAAAVVGRDFEVRHLADLVPDRSIAEIVELLDLAVGANLVAERPGLPGRYEFVHALVRDTLLSELSAARRGHLHRQIAELLAADGAPATTIVHHVLGAAPWSSSTDIGLWSNRAIGESVQALGWDEALTLAERAIEVLDLLPRPDPAARCTVLRAQSFACFMSGDIAASRATSMRAWEAAVQTEDPAVIAMAAIELGNWSSIGTMGENVVEVTEYALSVLPDDDVWTPLVSAWYETIRHMAAIPDPGRPGQVLAHLDRVRRSGDPMATWMVVNCCCYVFSADPDLDRWAGWVDEVYSSAAAATAGEASPFLRSIVPRQPDVGRLRFQVDARRGDVAAARARTARLAALRGRMDYVREFDAHTYEAMLALAEGRLADARIGIDAMGTMVGDDSSLISTWGAMETYLCIEEGHGHDMDAMLQIVIDQNPEFDVVHTLQGLVGARSGDGVPSARSVVDRLTTPDAVRIRFDAASTGGLANLARLIIEIGAADRAKAMYDFLLPYDGQWFSIGQGSTLLGSANAHLGALAALLARDDEADERLAHAITTEDELGLTLIATTTRIWWARALLERDVERAAGLLDGVDGTTQGLGLVGLATDAARARSKLGD